jgi:uncharacterized protein (TIGR00375 family)
VGTSRFFADLHVHSKFSRATSKDCDLEHLAQWARRKGIEVVATGDFTHPGWQEELCDKLVPAEPGLFRLREDLDREVLAALPSSCQRPVRFVLSVEISTIYKKGGRTRKIHHLVYAPSFDAARRFNESLFRIGNLASDGRPILGLDSRDLLEITLESDEGSYLVPAHVWTPWFAVLGSKSGFDTVEECYGDLAGHVFAVETGLSSDPPMNWRVSSLDRYRLVSNSDAHSPPMLGREACVFETDLDYFAMRRALETGKGYAGTVEFFPEEGKYHLDGHRKCGVRLSPEETRRLDGACPVCGKPVTVGVMHRVETLADRPPAGRPDRVDPFRSLVSLPEIVAEISGVGRKSKRVTRDVAALVERLGPELLILERVPLETIRRSGSTLVAEAIARLRRGEVLCEGGYDGEYGVIRMFGADELRRSSTAAGLFDEAVVAPDTESPNAAGPTGTVDVPSDQTAPKPTALEDGAAAASRSLSVTPLDPDQSVAVTLDRGPVLVIAGPGTGKTRTLTHRIAHLVRERGVLPQHCLAITFTRRAAEEMSTRLTELLPGLADDIEVATFHGLGLRILRDQHARLGLPRSFGVIDEDERLSLARETFGLSERRAKRLLEEISRWRRGEGFDSTPSAEQEQAAKLERYEDALRRKSVVDFDDLLALPVEMLGADAGLQEHYRDRHRFVAVDEYQDIEDLQYRLLRLLVPADGDIYAIGDPDQAIYGFRGSDVGFFMRFQEDFPAARVVQLSRNYRSTSTIVSAALQAIAPTTLVRDRALASVHDGAESEPIVIHAAASARAEADFVVRTIDQLLGGYSYFSLDSGRVGSNDGTDLSFADFAVLYRTDAQSEPLIEALERAGIPFQKRSHDRLNRRAEVKAIVRTLRRSPGQTEAVPVRDLVRSAAAQAIEAVATEPKASDDEAPEPPARRIRAAVDLLEPLAVRAGDDLAAFLAELSLGAEVDTWDPRADRVSLLTLHAAKGLEFPVVFVVGCEEGLLPLRWGTTAADPDQAAVEEERRLFFVGLTRAQSRVFLSHARKRSRSGKVGQVAASPFLRDIEEALLERRKAEGKRSGRTAPAQQQLRLL